MRLAVSPILPMPPKLLLAVLLLRLGPLPISDFAGAQAAASRVRWSCSWSFYIPVPASALPTVAKAPSIERKMHTMQRNALDGASVQVVAFNFAKSPRDRRGLHTRVMIRSPLLGQRKFMLVHTCTKQRGGCFAVLKQRT